ncbi:MAG: hypothetical protein AAF802_01835 [Planctomycetota bacterium]
MAKTFTDNMSHQWTLSLRLRHVRSAADRIGIDLLNPRQYLSLLESLTDRLTYVFLLCEEQAKEMKVDADGFEDLLYGDGFADQASIAFLAETEFFFQRLGQSHMALLARKAIESIKAGNQRLAELIQSGELESLLDAARAEMESQIPTPSRSSDGDSLPDSLRLQE